MECRDGLNGGSVRGGAQAKGAMSFSIVAATLIDMRAQRGARQQYEEGKRERRPAKLNATDDAESVARLLH